MKKIQFATSIFFIFFLAVGLSAQVRFEGLPELEVPSGAEGVLRVTALPDVPYVPSTDEIVAEMLKMAGVTEGDIVYDLGCGDGRIVIAAVLKGAASGIGIDIDPERIMESRQNAIRAKVSDRVRFYQNDLFETDISGASVVALYLLPDVNLRLRPKLLRELKPGTRIVSHNYHMDQWTPDSISNIGIHTIYSWIVPANVSGVWKIDIQSETGTSTMHLEQKFQKVTGTMYWGDSSLPIKDVELTGDKLSFTVKKKFNERVMSVDFKGKVSGNAIYGTATGEDGKWKRGNSWQAVRYTGTTVSFDRNT